MAKKEGNIDVPLEMSTGKYHLYVYFIYYLYNTHIMYMERVGKEMVSAGI